MTSLLKKTRQKNNCNEQMNTDMKKNLIEKLGLWCGLLLLAVSCTDETESMGQAASLTMEIRVDGGESRAIIDDGALPEGSFVGVTVVDASGTTYNNDFFHITLFFNIHFYIISLNHSIGYSFLV